VRTTPSQIDKLRGVREEIDLRPSQPAGALSGTGAVWEEIAELSERTELVRKHVSALEAKLIPIMEDVPTKANEKTGVPSPRCGVSEVLARQNQSLVWSTDMLASILDRLQI
jgi:hypothetical protein